MHNRPSVSPPAPAPWLPDAWGAPAPADPSADPAADAFVAGWTAPTADGAAGAPRPASPGSEFVFDSLPDLDAPHRFTWAQGERDWAALVADAADEREALVRAELAEAYAADLAAREAAHAEALEHAWAEGHATGCAAGEEAAHAAFADAAGALDAAVGEVRAHEERWMGDLRAHVAALAVAVAQHVVGREVAADDALVVALAARAVAEFPVQEPLAARVHPDDLGALKAAWERSAREGGVRWVPDARVARGGALVEGRERIVDGRVDAALERLYRALAGQAA